MSWDVEFDEPVPLPGGRTARTLRQAGEYVTRLPKNEASHEKWQTAAEALTLVAEHKGPAMFARMAVMAALNKDVPPPAAPSERKDRRWDGGCSRGIDERFSAAGKRPT